jgi:hypothetical protein
VQVWFQNRRQRDQRLRGGDWSLSPEPWWVAAMRPAQNPPTLRGQSAPVAYQYQTQPMAAAAGQLPGQLPCQLPGQQPVQLPGQLPGYAEAAPAVVCFGGQTYQRVAAPVTAQPTGFSPPMPPATLNPQLSQHAAEITSHFITQFEKAQRAASHFSETLSRLQQEATHAAGSSSGGVDFTSAHATPVPSPAVGLSPASTAVSAVPVAPPPQALGLAARAGGAIPLDGPPVSARFKPHASAAMAWVKPANAQPCDAKVSEQGAGRGLKRPSPTDASPNICTPLLSRPDVPYQNSAPGQNWAELLQAANTTWGAVTRTSAQPVAEPMQVSTLLQPPQQPM